VTHAELLSWPAALCSFDGAFGEVASTSDEENVSRCTEFRIYSSGSINSDIVANL